MKSLNILFAGVGGQGILFTSKIFFEAALARGQKVLGGETHGMSQRGGSVVAHFKMGESHSALVVPGTADVLLALEPVEGMRNMAFVRPGGIYLVNAPDLAHMSSAVRAYLERNDVRVFWFDADGRALEQKKPLTANLYLIGFLSGLADAPFSADELRGVITKVTKKKTFLKDNLDAFEVGRQAAVKGRQVAEA
jgi:indolepyruvate ferredoxin oxidoreductase beta subunit